MSANGNSFVEHQEPSGKWKTADYACGWEGILDEVQTILGA